MKLVLTNFIFPLLRKEKLHLKWYWMHLHTVWWSWGAINAFTLQHFKCINHVIRLMFYIFFLNIKNKFWKNAMILLNDKTTSRWQQMSVLVSESFINSFNHKCIILMNGSLNQLTHSIHSETWIHSETKHCCVLLRDTQQFCCDFDHNYFRLWNWGKTVNILSKI